MRQIYAEDNKKHAGNVRTVLSFGYTRPIERYTGQVVSSRRHIFYLFARDHFYFPPIFPPTFSSLRLGNIKNELKYVGKRKEKRRKMEIRSLFSIPDSKKDLAYFS